MRVLLDTNIVIHREANKVVIPEIGNLFNWLDRLKFEKCVHPLTITEIRKHQDANVVATFEKKINSYNILKTEAPESPQIQAIRIKYDKNDNDTIDTSMLKEVFSGRVDLFLTEDRKIHEKAKELGIAGRIFTIEAFLEKTVAENPDLVDYRVLSVRQEYFGKIDIADPFFDSFKGDYPGFENWFNGKSDETAYVCNEKDKLAAFLYVKTENPDENYSDIEPIFKPKRRLKIGTFKVISNGIKLGERFLKIVFDNAFQRQVDEIYVTIFDRTEDQKRLIHLLQDWGFEYHGVKHARSGDELVYVRNFRPAFNIQDPRLTYPYFSRQTNKFIVAIKPDYHTELLPDSILRTESSEDFIDNRPNRNAISKVFISRSIERNLKSGDVIVFYRTADGGSAYYTSVTTTIGIVQEVIDRIPSLQRFIELCRKRSVFSDGELAEWWNWNPRNRPFIVNFLYVYSFPRRLNLKILKESNIIANAPRGFDPLDDAAFENLMENSNADLRLVVD